MKKETLRQRDARHAQRLHEASGSELSGPMVYAAIRASVYAVLPGRQRKRAYFDAILETAVRAGCRALRRYR